MGIKDRALTFVCLLLGACTMGPDFTKPETQTLQSWWRGSASNQPADSRLMEGVALDQQWWHGLNDPLLDRFIERLAEENFDVRTATARLEESRAQLGIAGADLFPQLTGNASYTREKLSDKGVIGLVSGSGAPTSGASSANGIPSPQTTPPFDVYQYGFDASWEIDLWGRIRRGEEAAAATVQASEDARRGVMLSVIAEMASDYVQLRGAQQTLATLRKEFETAQRLGALAKDRASAGLGSEIDVANEKAQIATIQAQIPHMEQQEAALMNAMALLLAQAPGTLDADLSAPYPLPRQQPQIPIGLPSELLQRRPDIRQAEAQLHAATAQIGVAKAEFFPSLTLMGSGMLQALTLSDLNTWAARSYSLGPSVSLPLFEGGRLVSTLHLRQASQREAALQYRKTVLTAFHEVDNALTALRTEQQRGEALTDAAEQNRRALALATDRYKQGLGDFLTVLTDEQNLLGTEQQSIQSTEASYLDRIQLYKALGGGWENYFPDSARQP